MPQIQTLTITNTESGLHLEKDALHIADGATPDCANVVFDMGTIKKRPGRVRHAAGGNERAIVEFYVPSATPTTRLVTARGNAIYWTTDTAQATFAEVDGLVIHATNPVRMVQFNDLLYICDGENPVRTLSMVGVVTALVDKQVPSVAPGLVVNQLSSTLGDCHTGDALGYWLKPDTTHNTFDETEFTPEADAWSDGEFGITSRLIGGAAFQYGEATDTVGFEIVSKVSTIGNPAGTRWMSGTYRWYRDLGAVADYSRIQSWLMRYNMQANGGSFRVFLQFDGGATKPATDGDWDVTIELKVDGKNFRVYQEVKYTLTAEEQTALAAVRWIAVKVVAYELREIKRPDYAPEIAFDTCEYGVTLLVDNIFPVIEDITLVDGTYEFTYLYEYAGVKSSHYQSDDEQTPYPTAVISEGIVYGIDITCTLDAATAGDYDTLRIFARGGTSFDFREITQKNGITVAPGGPPYTLKWDGSYNAASFWLPVFVGAPPAKASLCATFNNRMVYVAPTPRGGSTIHDTLFFSNINEASLVPTKPAPMSRTPADYGGWEQLHTKNMPVSGIGSLGRVLIAFQHQTTHMVMGTPGQVDFDIVELSRSRGCQSHESIQQLDGSILVWLDADGVWGFDGNGFIPVGRAVDKRVQGLTAAQKQGAYSYVDRTNRLYVLGLPATGTAAAAPAATALVAHLDVRVAIAEGWQYAWTEFTAQPGGCAAYIEHAATPGIYSGDPYATGYVYRVMTGSVDATAATAAVAISWYWTSKVFQEPFPQLCKQLGRIEAHTGLSGYPTSLTLAIRCNGKVTDDQAQTVTVDALPGAPGLALWIPARMADVQLWQVKVSSSSTTADEIRNIGVTISEAGRWK